MTVHVKMSIEKKKAAENTYDRYETLAEFAIEADVAEALAVYQRALGALTAQSVRVSIAEPPESWPETIKPSVP